MTQQRNNVTAKPHLRKSQGYWRVSATPVKWAKLSTESQSLFRRAHIFVNRKNNERRP